MSFEGFYQILCRNGHLTEVDAFDYKFTEESWLCPICKETVAHQNLVTQTNCCIGFKKCDDEESKKTCCEIGIGYRKFEIFEEEKLEVCDKCGSVKIVHHARYRIPSDLKLADLRNFLNSIG